MPDRVSGQAPIAGVSVIGMALNGATTGPKLTYTCPVGRAASLFGVAVAHFVGGTPSVHVQAIIGGVTISLATTTGNLQYTGGAFLNPGDSIVINVVTLAAGSTFDAAINVQEFLAA